MAHDINKGNVTDVTTKALHGVHSQTIVVSLKAIFSLGYFALMSRLLTPDDFGYFALITAVTTILSSLSEAGLGSAVIQKKNASKRFISTAFTLSVILGLFFSTLLFWGAGFFSNITTGTDTLSLAYKIMSVIILLQAINNITWSVYMRKLDFFKYGKLQIIADILSYALGIAFAYMEFGFYAIVAGVASNQIFLTIILFIMGKYEYSIRIEKIYVREIISYGGWLTAAVIMRNFTNEIDKIIIGRILPITDLGAINRPQGFISRISSQINSIVDTVLFPILSSIQDDRQKISRGYLKIVSLVVTFSFILGSIVSLGSNLIIDIFFGSQWHHLQFILMIFAFAMIFHGYSRVADSFFRSLGIVKKYFIARFINWLLVISFVVIGCSFGIIGASIGIVIGSFVSCLIKFLMQRNEVGINVRSFFTTCIKSITAPALCAIFGFLIRISMPYGEYLGVLAFIIVIFLSIWFTPKAYTPVFREIIIHRYLKRF